MKKQVFGRQFKRDANERKALFKGLMDELVLHERIKTTEQKAKAIRGKVEKLVTKAKIRKSEARQYLQPYLSAKAVEKVLTDLSLRFADRPGGYTRIVKLGRRFSDNAAMAIIEWVEKPVQVEIIEPAGAKETEGPKGTKGPNEKKRPEIKKIEAAVAVKAKSSKKKEEAKTKKKDDKKKTTKKMSKS